MVRKFKVLLTKEAQQHKTLEQMILFLKESGLRADAIFISKNHEFFCSCVGINNNLADKMKLSYDGINGLFFKDWHGDIMNTSELTTGFDQNCDTDWKKEFQSAKEKHSEVLKKLYKFWQREVLFYSPEIFDGTFGETFSSNPINISLDGIVLSCCKDFFNPDNLADDVFAFWPTVSVTGEYASTTQVVQMISRILEIKIKNFDSSTKKINSEIFGTQNKE